MRIDLIGREIVYIDGRTGETVTGVVTAVSFAGQQLSLLVGDDAISLSQILEIREEVPASELVLQASGLIGREVTYVDEETGEAVAGLVAAVDLDGDEIRLAVGDDVILLSQVIGIRQPDSQ